MKLHSKSDFKEKLVQVKLMQKNCQKSVYDVYPDSGLRLLDKKIKRDKLKYEMKPTAMTDQFKCVSVGQVLL